VSASSEETIRRWFSENHVIYLSLPGRSFGRPGEDTHLVTSLQRLSAWLLVELDRNYLLVIKEPTGAGVEGRRPVAIDGEENDLFVSFSSCFFDRCGGFERTWQVDTFTWGEVRFRGGRSPFPECWLGKCQTKKKWKNLIENWFHEHNPGTARLLFPGEEIELRKPRGNESPPLSDTWLLSATVLSHWVVLDLWGGILLVFRNPKRVARKRRIKLKLGLQKCCDELVVRGYTACIYDTVSSEEAPSRPLVFTGGEVRFLGRDLDPK